MMVVMVGKEGLELVEADPTRVVDVNRVEERLEGRDLLKEDIRCGIDRRLARLHLE